MKVPFILITYGLSQKLFSWEEEGVHKLPFFTEPAVADLFIKSAVEHMGEMLQDKEPPQIQVCEEPRYALDMIRVIGASSPGVTIILNPPPIGEEDPHAAIGAIAGQFQDMATVINKHYDIEEMTDAIQELADAASPSDDSESSDDSEE